MSDKVDKSEMLKDPVCHMLVHETGLSFEYEGKHYVFCSEQCKFRFIFTPHLYLSSHGHLPPKQQGQKIIKCRKFKLDAHLDLRQTDITKSALYAMMGIEEVKIEGDKIEIKYDLLQITTEQISDELSSIGAKLGGGWITQLQLAFINNIEEIEIQSLEVKNKK